MVSDFGLARDIYESGAYETTSGVWQCFIFFFNFYFFYKWMQNLGINYSGFSLSDRLKVGGAEF